MSMMNGTRRLPVTLAGSGVFITQQHSHTLKHARFFCSMRRQHQKPHGAHTDNDNALHTVETQHVVR